MNPDTFPTPLTRREYFAAHIITGLLSRFGSTDNPESIQYIVEAAFRIADEMERVSETSRHK